MIKITIQITVFCFIFINNIEAQNNNQIFKDTLDNAFDVSYFLTKKRGVLPFIIPITEPAVGYGAVGGALHFIPKKESNERPDIIVAAGGGTSNKTWLIGGGYIGFWKSDNIRYRGVIGYADVNLEYYGIFNRPISFNLKSFILIQQANFRLGKSNFFLGGKYQFSKITIPLFENVDIIDPIDFDLRNSGVSLITEFDNLNNFMSPTKGLKVHFSYDQNLEIIGSDRNWGRINFFSYWYIPVNDKWIPAFRLESTMATGATPFYAEPFVSLRGVPALRYQGELTLLVETEQLYNITSRWGILGFTGLGTAFDTVENLESDELVWNVGGGVRYLIARALGLKVGADIARGPEDWAFYITIGTSWLR